MNNSIVIGGDLNLNELIDGQCEKVLQIKDQTVVRGTFKGTTDRQRIDIDLNYTGAGYPIVVIIYPTAWVDGGFDALKSNYAIGMYSMTKRKPDVAPDYAGYASDADQGVILYLRKNSSSSASIYTWGSSRTQPVYSDKNADSGLNCVLIKSPTKMQVFFANIMYAFALDIEYSYVVIYSE